MSYGKMSLPRVNLILIPLGSCSIEMSFAWATSAKRILTLCNNEFGTRMGSTMNEGK